MNDDSSSQPDQLAVLRTIVARLDDVSVPYMLTGSMALSFYAVPRMTRDIDIVVELDAARGQTLGAAHGCSRSRLHRAMGRTVGSLGSRQQRRCPMRPTDTIPADTSPEIDSLYRSLLMRRSGAERLRMGAAMFDAARATVVAHVRSDAANMSDVGIRAAVFNRIYATDLDEQTRARVVERIRG